MTDTLTSFAQAKLDALAADNLKRTLTPTHRLDGLWVERAGRRLLSFSCNDYLNLSHHPAVKAAATEAIGAYGAGAGASRLVTGDHPILPQLEARLARLKGTEAACVFGSGYLANAGLIPTILGAGDMIFVDELSHACIWAGAKLSGAEVVTFRHNDVADLAAKLAVPRGNARTIVATEGVFSMDGDIAPLDRLSALCEVRNAWLLVDDAHGLGVVGEGGRGTASLFQTAKVHLQMGTLSKALGSYGAYVAASQPVVDLLKTRARTLVYTTGLPPASAAAALAALDVLESDPDLAAQPIGKARRFTRQLNLPQAESAIVPVILGDAVRALNAARKLEEEGFLGVAIRPPTVPAGTARLRIAFTAGHPDEAVDDLARAVGKLLAA